MEKIVYLNTEFDDLKYIYRWKNKNILTHLKCNDRQYFEINWKFSGFANQSKWNSPAIEKALRWTDFRFPMIYMMITWDGLRICMLIWVFVYFHITYIHSVKRKHVQRAVSFGIIGGKSKKLKQNISCKGFLRRFKCKKNIQKYQI